MGNSQPRFYEDNHADNHTDDHMDMLYLITNPNLVPERRAVQEVIDKITEQSPDIQRDSYAYNHEYILQASSTLR